jgi:hypothetical protein
VGSKFVTSQKRSLLAGVGVLVLGGLGLWAAPGPSVESGAVAAALFRVDCVWAMPGRSGSTWGTGSTVDQATRLAKRRIPGNAPSWHCVWKLL